MSVSLCLPLSHSCFLGKGVRTMRFVKSSETFHWTAMSQHWFVSLSGHQNQLVHFERSDTQNSSLSTGLRWGPSCRQHQHPTDDCAVQPALRTSGVRKENQLRDCCLWTKETEMNGLPVSLILLNPIKSELNRIQYWPVFWHLFVNKMTTELWPNTRQKNIHTQERI